MPLVTIILPVKNGEDFIEDSLKSILNQSFTDYELLIFNDLSTDNTLGLIKKHKGDHRIKIFNEPNGFVENLNKGISIAKGKYIARMDADDIMNEDRLKTQVEIMNQDPKIDVCASWMNVFGANTKMHTTNGMANRVENPLLSMILGNILSHPTVMIKKEFLEIHNLQYSNYQYAEDYKLWVEIAKRRGVFYIIPEPLLNYRVSPNQVSIIHYHKMMEQTNRIQKDIIEYLMIHYSFNDKDSVIKKLYNDLSIFESNKLISFDNISNIFYQLFKAVKPEY